MNNRSQDAKKNIYAKLADAVPLKSAKKTYVSLGLYSLYHGAHTSSNKVAEMFLKKRHVNPNQKPYVNEIRLISEDQLNLNPSKICEPNINYGDLVYMHQERVIDCLDTSFEMIMNYHKNKCKNITERKLIINKFQEKFNKRKMNLFLGKGFKDIQEHSPFEIVERDLSAAKDKCEIEVIAYYLYKYGPVVADIRGRIGYHALVIKGIINDEVIIHDPWYGPNIIYSFEDFKKVWCGTLEYFTYGYSNKLENEIAAKNLKESNNKSEIDYNAKAYMQIK